MLTQKTYCESPLNYAISTISGKWKASILWYLSSSSTSVRYARLKKMIPFEISHKVFSQQLKDMVDDEIIERNVLDTENKNVTHVEYALTPKGRSLCNIIFLLRDWGSVYGNFDAMQELKHSRGSFQYNEVVYSSSCEPEQSCVYDEVAWHIVSAKKRSSEEDVLQKAAV